MQPRQSITLGFEPTDINGRFTILIDGKPRYMGLTFDKREARERIAWLERSCEVTFDEARLLPENVSSVPINRPIRTPSRPQGDCIMTTKNDGNGTTKRARVTKQTLAQMIENGVIKGGQKISAFYKDNEIAGTIRQDCTVRLTSASLKAVDGQVYGSLSDAGRAVCTAAGNAKASINGYTFFGVKNAEGKVVPVASLRQ